MILRLLSFISQVVLIGSFMVIGSFFSDMFQCVSDVAYAAEVTFAWDANSESNLAGYALYYESEYDTSSYEGQDANEGDSPITIYLDEFEDLSSPLYTVSGLEAGTYYCFAITAFDQDGIESDFSNEVCGTTDKETANSEEGANSCFISTSIGAGSGH